MSNVSDAMHELLERRRRDREFHKACDAARKEAIEAEREIAREANTYRAGDARRRRGRP